MYTIDGQSASHCDCVTDVAAGHNGLLALLHLPYLNPPPRFLIELFYPGPNGSDEQTPKSFVEDFAL